MIWKDDPEAINYVKKRKNMKTYEELDTNLGEISEASQRELEAKAEIRLNMDTKESQENSVYCVVFFLSLFFTLSFNFYFSNTINIYSSSSTKRYRHHYDTHKSSFVLKEENKSYTKSIQIAIKSYT